MRRLSNVILTAAAIAGGFACGYILFMTPRTPTATLEPAPAPRQAAPVPPPAADLHVNTDWNTYHGSAAFTGAVDWGLPERLGLVWRFKAGGPVFQTPVVHKGLVFFATGRGEVIAVNPAGERVWSRKLFSGVQGKDGPLHAEIEAPLACFGGRVIVGTMGGMVHALDAASGVEQWRVEIDSPVMGSPNYLETGAGARVYVIGRANAVLHCIDAATGSVLWQSEEIDRCDGSPAVSERAVAFGSCAAALHVLSPETGALVRNIELDADSQIAGGVALDGDWIVSGSRSGRVLQANLATGQVAWTSTEIEAEVFTTPAVTADRAVIAAEDGCVYALDRASGKLVWKFNAGGTPSSAIVAGDKTLVSANGTLFVLSTGDGRKLWEFKVSDEISGPAVANGRVYVGSEDGTVVAFAGESEAGTTGAAGGALPGSDWVGEGEEAK